MLPASWLLLLFTIPQEHPWYYRMPISFCVGIACPILFSLKERLIIATEQGKTQERLRAYGVKYGWSVSDDN